MSTPSSFLQQFDQSVGGKKNRNILLSVIGLVIVSLVILLVILMTQRNQTVSQAGNSRENTAEASGSSFKSTVSDLSGSVARATANLKGLTLRINQVETCNPAVVSAYVAVSSESGVVNKNFTKQDVKVYVDGKQVNDFDFNPVDAQKTPITSVLAVDSSGSMAGEPIDKAKSAATRYVNAMQPSDQTGLVTFSTSVDVLNNPTNDKNQLLANISAINAVGDTALYDAIAQSVAMTPSCGRKAVVVLSDGEDTLSKSNTKDSAIAVANKATMPVFVVGVKSDGFKPDIDKEISEATGAQYLEANTPSEIADLYSKIDAQIKGQFVANLKLSLPKDGTTHTLKITSNVEGSETSSERQFTY